MKSIETASQVLRVMVAGVTGNSNDANLPKTAECIKKRLIETTTEETQMCFIKVLEKGTEEVDSKVAARIAQLRE